VWPARASTAPARDSRKFESVRLPSARKSSLICVLEGARTQKKFTIDQL